MTGVAWPLAGVGWQGATGSHSFFAWTGPCQRTQWLFAVNLSAIYAAAACVSPGRAHLS